MNENAKVIAVSYQKGGVGKTIVAVNVAAFLSALGYRVLLIDNDTHSSATKYLGVYSDDELSTYDVLIGSADIKDAIKTLTYKYGKAGEKKLDILPANEFLHHMEEQAFGLDNSECRLKEALKTVSQEYDYVIIDCPPESDILLKNAFNSANYFILPTLPDANCFQELSPTISQINDLTTVPERGKILGCILNQKSNRPLFVNGQELYIKDLYKSVIDLFETELPVSSYINNSFANNLPIPFYHANIRRCDNIYYAFRRLTTEILKKIEESE